MRSGTFDRVLLLHVKYAACVGLLNKLVTNSLNSADVPLSNKQTFAHHTLLKLCDRLLSSSMTTATQFFSAFAISDEFPAVCNQCRSP